MKKNRSFILLCVAILYAGICSAGSNQNIALSGKSESGKVALDVKKKDASGGPYTAHLTIGAEAMDLEGDCDIYDIVDLRNHIITMFFHQKGSAAEAPDAKSVKVWAIPSSFVKGIKGDNSWRFKARIDYSIGTTKSTDPVILDCTIE
jgi:hypothetical protein